MLYVDGHQIINDIIQGRPLTLRALTKNRSKTTNSSESNKTIFLLGLHIDKQYSVHKKVFD